MGIYTYLCEEIFNIGYYMRKLTIQKHNQSSEKSTNNLITEEQELHKEPETWTIITALDIILTAAEDSNLSDEFWEICKSPLDFLTEKLGLTKMQIVILAILVEMGEPMSWRGFGKYLDCSRLTIMTYSEEIEDLVAKRWIIRRGVREIGGSFQGFALARGVVTALRRNQVFIPEQIDNLSLQDLVEKMETRIDRNMNNNLIEFSDDEEWMLQMCNANPQLPLCNKLQQFKNDIHIQSLFLLIVIDYSLWADSEDEGLNLSTIDHIYPMDYETNGMRKKLKDGSHPLIKAGLIEHKCVDGIANPEAYSLTRYSKEELLCGYVPSRAKCPSKQQKDKSIKSHTLIKEKDMFYNATEQEQIERLTSLLSQENLPSIQKRLEEEGMRKGFACLFYGAPGTGKTETVLQIARKTGRDILQIDIAGMRDKYVGESEKNIKAVFQRYRDICKNSDVIPILFFNEADGIFGKRSTSNSINPSVTKMDNAMQNIILQEIEDLEGILIATTNLTCNLDSAFERRFLFKIEFEKPSIDVKAKLWSSMLGSNISNEEAMMLAKRFDFSGGQIENIARKRTIDYILSGKKATIDEIERFCKSELLDKNTERRSIGFAC